MGTSSVSGVNGCGMLFRVISNRQHSGLRPVRQGKASYTAVSRQRRAEPRYRAQIVAEHTSRKNNNTLHINTKPHKYITICGKAGRSRKT